jgi:hypothetical protein
LTKKFCKFYPDVCQNILSLIALINKSNQEEGKFKRTEKYESYGRGIADCRSCKKFPAEFEDPHASDATEKSLCQII